MNPRPALVGGGVFWLGDDRILGRIAPPISGFDPSDAATAKARDGGDHTQVIETMREKGDEDGADVGLRIIVAIGTLGEPPSAARH